MKTLETTIFRQQKEKKKGSLLRYFLELHSKLTFKVLLEAMTVVTCK